MLISKFDLYNPEWLELVFNNRNKEYGAYELRRHYGRNMTAAMAITFLSVGLLCGAAMIFRSSHTNARINPDQIHFVSLTPPPAMAIKKPDPPAPEALKPQPPAHPVATTRFVPPVVVSDPLAETPPKIDQLANTAIGPTNSKGDETKGNEPLPVTSGPGTGPAPVVDNVVHDVAGVDVMPTPVGGEAAWAKFLNKNLRYPEQAQADGVSGRVFMSFVVEKDGTLSNIDIERGAGHGFDEEAARVLKLARAWKPGMQNGQPVRVKYIIPINFQFSDEP